VLAPLAQFDHLVVAVRSLEEGVAEFERLTGVKAGAGGKHPGRGTENALVSFGGGKYLEIIAPQAGATLGPRDEPMRKLDRLRVINWAISVSDVAGAVAALKGGGFTASPPQPGSRVTPAGERLEWTTFGLADPAIPVAPFFINWSAATKHPSTTAPGGCEMPDLKITDPASDRLSAALGVLGVSGVTYAKGPLRMDATIRCGARTTTLTTPTV
jgi:Glyoxalase-like domain